MSDVVSGLSRDEARRLTDEVKRDAAAGAWAAEAVRWERLLVLYEAGAHLALGFSSWGAFFGAEFGRSESTGYRRLMAARVMRLLEEPGAPSRSEAVARGLLSPALGEGPALLLGTMAEEVERAAEARAAGGGEDLPRRRRVALTRLRAVAARMLGWRP